ncbi:hypothetical protein J6590_001057 [Homalodisca vitripennis]|nr:hypothetical protein J6590_001057 [Homalodisca vitripennis]
MVSSAIICSQSSINTVANTEARPCPSFDALSMSSPLYRRRAGRHGAINSVLSVYPPPPPPRNHSHCLYYGQHRLWAGATKRPELE